MSDYLFYIFIFSFIILAIVNLLYYIEAKPLVLFKNNNERKQKRIEYANKLLKIRILLMLAIFILIVILKYVYDYKLF
jgi:Na+-driven multidrug efflux pump